MAECARISPKRDPLDLIRSLDEYVQDEERVSRA